MKSSIEIRNEVRALDDNPLRSTRIHDTCRANRAQRNRRDDSDERLPSHAMTLERPDKVLPRRCIPLLHLCHRPSPPASIITWEAGGRTGFPNCRRAVRQGSDSWDTTRSAMPKNVRIRKEGPAATDPMQDGRKRRGPQVPSDCDMCARGRADPRTAKSGEPERRGAPQGHAAPGSRGSRNRCTRPERPARRSWRHDRTYPTPRARRQAWRASRDGAA